MYLENTWYVAAWSDEVGERPLARRILGRPVVLFRGAGGRAAALDDCCPHRLAPLSLGEVDGDWLRCGYHGLAFDCAGTCQDVPGQDNIPRWARVRSYVLAEKWNLAWIWMGDPAAADPALIPDCPWLVAPDWSYSHGLIDYQCHYLLLIDNLLDLSHTTFTHKGTIGTDSSAANPVRAHRSNGTVHIERLMNDAAPSPMYRAVGGFEGNVDRWQRIAYEPPGNIIIDAGAVPAGSNDPSRGIDTRIINFLTPATDESVHHFWAFARNFAVGDPAMTDFIRQQIEVTFNEDRAVLDGQQARMSERPEQPLRDKNADTGLVLARRLLEERIEQEARLRRI